MGKQKLFLILNGKKSGDPDVRAAVKHLRKEGHTVDVRITYEEDDTERFTAEALKAPCDAIVIAGGDGSINQMANALIKLDAPPETRLGIIPMGTANDFATGLGIPDDPWEALQLATHKTANPVDVGLVNGKAFLNVATGGFGTEVTVQTDDDLKDKMGGAAYLFTGIAKFSSIASKTASIKGKVSATVERPDKSYAISTGPDKHKPKDEDGKKLKPLAEGSTATAEGDLLILAVGNGKQAGGGVLLCPDAVLDDGLLDVSYVMNISKEDFPALVKGLGNLKDTGELTDSFGTMRVTELEVHCPEGLQINCDGEPMRDTKFTFSVLKKRLMVHMPEPKLLRRSSKELKHGEKAFHKKIAHTAKRPFKHREGFWQKDTVQTPLKYSAAIGVGVALTLGAQRLAARRSSLGLSRFKFW
ncbi:hypothetical protein WJX73_009820 [Symbiochloris irregularis]|uniref:DAGKc domain-containing protein n=1 Tax=Symbiochloris irregularis TaxID=706552 RepID=A0AAW1P1F5_9CHLO